MRKFHLLLLLLAVQQITIFAASMTLRGQSDRHRRSLQGDAHIYLMLTSMDSTSTIPVGPILTVSTRISLLYVESTTSTTGNHITIEYPTVSCRSDDTPGQQLFCRLSKGLDSGEPGVIGFMGLNGGIGNTALMNQLCNTPFNDWISVSSLQWDTHILTRAAGVYYARPPELSSNYCGALAKITFINEPNPSNYTYSFYLSDDSSSLVTIHSGSTAVSFGYQRQFFTVASNLLTGRRYNDTVAWTYSTASGFHRVVVTAGSLTSLPSVLASNFLYSNPLITTISDLKDFEITPEGDIVYLTMDSKLYYAQVTDPESVSPTISLPGDLIYEPTLSDISFGGVSSHGIFPTMSPSPSSSPSFSSTTSSTSSPSATFSTGASPSVTPTVSITSTVTPSASPVNILPYHRHFYVSAMKVRTDVDPSEVVLQDTYLADLTLMTVGGTYGNGIVYGEKVASCRTDGIPGEQKFCRLGDRYNYYNNDRAIQLSGFVNITNENLPFPSGLSREIYSIDQGHSSRRVFLDPADDVINSYEDSSGTQYFTAVSGIYKCLGPNPNPCLFSERLTFLNEPESANYTKSFLYYDKVMGIVYGDSNYSLAYNGQFYESSKFLITGASSAGRTLIYSELDGFQSVMMGPMGLEVRLVEVQNPAVRLIPDLKSFTLGIYDIVYITKSGKIYSAPMEHMVGPGGDVVILNLPGILVFEASPVEGSEIVFSDLAEYSVNSPMPSGTPTSTPSQTGSPTSSPSPTSTLSYGVTASTTPTASATFTPQPTYALPAVVLSAYKERIPQNGEVLIQDSYYIELYLHNTSGTEGNHIQFIPDEVGCRTSEVPEELKYCRLVNTVHPPIVMKVGYVNYSTTGEEVFPIGTQQSVSTYSSGWPARIDLNTGFNDIVAFMGLPSMNYNSRFIRSTGLYECGNFDCSSSQPLFFTNQASSPNMTASTYSVYNSGDWPFSYGREGAFYNVSQGLKAGRDLDTATTWVYGERGFQSIWFNPSSFFVNDFFTTGFTKTIPNLYDFTVLPPGSNGDRDIVYLTTDGGVYYARATSTYIPIIELPGTLVYQASEYENEKIVLAGIANIPNPPYAPSPNPSHPPLPSSSASPTSTFSPGASASPTPVAPGVSVVLSIYKEQIPEGSEVLIQDSYYAQLNIQNTAGESGNRIVTYTPDDVGCRTEVNGERKYCGLSKNFIDSSHPGLCISRVGYINASSSKTFPTDFRPTVSVFKYNEEPIHLPGPAAEGDYIAAITGGNFYGESIHIITLLQPEELGMCHNAFGVCAGTTPSILSDSPSPLSFTRAVDSVSYISYGPSSFSLSLGHTFISTRSYIVAGRRYDNLRFWIYSDVTGFALVSTDGPSITTVDFHTTTSEITVPNLFDFEILPNGDIIYVTKSNGVYYVPVTNPDSVQPTITLPGTLVYQATTYEDAPIVIAGLAYLPDAPAPTPIPSVSASPSASPSASASASPAVLPSPSPSPTPGGVPLYDIVLTKTSEEVAPKKDGQYYLASTSLVRVKVYNVGGQTGNIVTDTEIPTVLDTSLLQISKFNRVTSSFNRVTNSFDNSQIQFPVYGAVDGNLLNGQLAFTYIYDSSDSWTYRYTGYLDGVTRMSASLDASSPVFVATTEYIGSCEQESIENITCDEVFFEDQGAPGELNFTALFFMSDSVDDLVAIQNKDSLSTFSHNGTTIEVSPNLIAGKNNNGQYAWVYGLVNGFETVDVSNGYSTGSFRVPSATSRIIPDLKDFIVLPDRNIVYITYNGSVIFVEVSDSNTAHPFLNLPGTVINEAVGDNAVYGGIALYPVTP